ncbi:MAG: hypothetical protein WEA56_08985 [Balneolaceae bacterium]
MNPSQLEISPVSKSELSASSQHEASSVSFKQSVLARFDYFLQEELKKRNQQPEADEEQAEPFFCETFVDLLVEKGKSLKQLSDPVPAGLDISELILQLREQGGISKNNPYPSTRFSSSEYAEIFISSYYYNQEYYYSPNGSKFTGNL